MRANRAAAFAALLCLAVSASADTLRLHVNHTQIGMGFSVLLSARLTRAGRPVAGAKLQTACNGKRWGADCITGADGRAELPLPLPNPGTARLQMREAPHAHKADWIWGAQVTDHQTLYFEKTFFLPHSPRSAHLWITCDDSLRLFLNGREVAVKQASLFEIRSLSHLAAYFHKGSNTIAVEGNNGTGPAGLLALLHISENRKQSFNLSTDPGWQVYGTAPAGWPNRAEVQGEPAVSEAPAGQGVWGSALHGWPGMNGPFVVGQPLASGGIRSNIVQVRVLRVPVLRPPQNSKHLVIMDWEEWFGPLNARWDTAEATPVIGDYASSNPDVIRQHLLWLTRAGVDDLLVDWSNNLSGHTSWSQMGPGVFELAHNTRTLLQVCAQMRKQHIQVPGVVLLFGVNNLPDNTPVEDQQLDYAARRFLQNSRYHDLWLRWHGRPLAIVLNGGGPAYQARQKPLQNHAFTLRWMWTQDQMVHYNRQGYWSWMDGSLHPRPTMHAGKCEALTITPAFFPPDGWLAPGAYGKRNGWTYLVQWRDAMKLRPRFLLLNQWNEFAGQPVGGGYGPKHDVYVDIYSEELSDDMEPVSVQLPGLRSRGGEGYRDYNLTSAAIRMYHGEYPSDTILAVYSPDMLHPMHSRTLHLQWAFLGRKPAGCTVLVDGRVAARNVQGNGVSIRLPWLKPGVHRLTVKAEKAYTHFEIARLKEDVPLKHAEPVLVKRRFLYQPIFKAIEAQPK